MRIRIFIVSNVRLLREGLAALLRECPSIEVLAATSVRETPNALLAAATDIVAADVALIDSLSPATPDGVMSDTVATLRNLCKRIRIVAFGIRETASEVLACAAAGIDGYVPMDATLRDMVFAIENVVRGELACSPKVAACLYHSVGSSRSIGLARTAVAGTQVAAGVNPLTTRELQVAELMYRGCPTKEIAWRLGVRPCTAKNHIRNILHKLQVRRRGQAVAKLQTMIGEHLGDGRLDGDHVGGQ